MRHHSERSCWRTDDASKSFIFKIDEIKTGDHGGFYHRTLTHKSHCRNNTFSVQCNAADTLLSSTVAMDSELLTLFSSHNKDRASVQVRRALQKWKQPKRSGMQYTHWLLHGCWVMG